MFEAALTVDPAEVHPHLAAVAAALVGRVPRGGTASESDLRLRSLLTLSRQVESALLAEIAAFDTQGFAPAVGAKSTGAYLAAHGHLDPSAARRLVVAARTADRLPQLGAMLTAGDIGVDHVAAVGFATSRLPQDVVASQDAVFATLAASGRPAQLRAAGKHLQAVYDTDAVSRDAHHVRDSRYLTLAQTFADVWHLEGQLTPQDGLALSLVLDSLATKAGAEDNRTATQRRADALVEMTALTLRAGELPDTGGDQPRVTLLVQQQTNPFAHLTDDDPDDAPDDGPDVDDGPGAGAASRAGRTSGGLSAARHCGGVQQRRSGTRFTVTGFGLADAQLLGAACQIPAETMHRICCDAQFNVATIDATGNLMNLGRSSRDPNLAQKRAVKLRDKHCVFPGCDTPPHRCQVHHLHYWGKGGCTDLCNLALVCHFHHHLIHEDHWTLTATPPTPEHPAGGWTARAPNGYQIRQFRERAA